MSSTRQYDGMIPDLFFIVQINDISLQNLWWLFVLSRFIVSVSKSYL